MSISMNSWVGVRMTQRRIIDTVRHFGTEGHFDTATKLHGVLLINYFLILKT